MEAIFEFAIEFVLEAIFGAVDETTQKYKKVVRRTILTVLPTSIFAFLIAIPILGETNGKSVLGLVLISILPVMLITLFIIYIIFKIKNK